MCSSLVVLSLTKLYLPYFLGFTSISQFSFFVQFSRCYLVLSDLVGTSGLEPPTSRLSGVRSNHLSYAPSSLSRPLVSLRPSSVPFAFTISLTRVSLLPFPSHFHVPSRERRLTAGGDEEVRTPDPLRARQVLSQLSYTPVSLPLKMCFSAHPQNRTT